MELFSVLRERVFSELYKCLFKGGISTYEVSWF